MLLLLSTAVEMNGVVNKWAAVAAVGAVAAVAAVGGKEMVAVAAVVAVGTCSTAVAADAAVAAVAAVADVGRCCSCRMRWPLVTSVCSKSSVCSSVCSLRVLSRSQFQEEN